jgi:signal transduction histidine kinase
MPRFGKLIAILAVMVLLIIGIISYLRYSDFIRNTASVAEQSVLGASSQISLRIQELRHRVRLFAADRKKFLQRLAISPTDKDLLSRLTNEVKLHFPDYFAFTIANDKGETLLEGFDQFVGKGCRRDIRKFVGKIEKYGVYIHSSPGKRPFHFDVMVPFEYEMGKSGVFFVSFLASNIANIINKMEVKDHKLYLLLSRGEKTLSRMPQEGMEAGNQPYKIEISALGARDELTRNPILTNEERGQILSSKPVASTRWVLVDLPSRNFVSSEIISIVTGGTVISGILLLMGFVLIKQMSKVDALRAMGKTLKLRTDDLHTALADAQLANQAKSEFLAHMSHEFRTPLNSIIGYSQMISGEEIGKLNNPKYIEYANDISSSGQHLLEVINDILDLSKIESKEFEIEESDIDIREIVDGSLSFVCLLGESKDLNLKGNIASALPRLRADGRLIRQILINLLTNAVKFTPEGGHVTATAGLDDHGGIVLSVEDTGMGIAPEDIQKALEPFGQVRKNPEIASEGTGLGLSLSKRLAELHGGTLSIASKVGQGTMVNVKFPPERTLRS